MACRPAERLGHLRIVLNLSISDFAAALNVSERRIMRLLKARTKPSISLIARVRRSFQTINPDWLILGEGPVFLDHTSTATAGNNVVLSNTGTTHQTTVNIHHNCELDLQACKAQVALLEQQLADKRRIIQLLEKLQSPESL